MELTRTVVPTLRYVTESTVREAADERYCSSQSYLSLLLLEWIVLLLYLVSYFMVLLSMVPSYELWMNVIQPSSVWIAVPALAMMLGTQTISFLVLQSGPWRHIKSDEVERRKAEYTTERKTSTERIDIEAQL
jgi:hypothetical protein